MLSKLKKMLIVIPCMILGLFLFSNVRVSAADAVLLGTNNSIVIGEENKENTYYYTNGKIWEFKAKYDAIGEWDTYLKYRVVRPDGKATDWSGDIYYVDTGGKFTIGDYTSLNYNKTEDISTRNSVAPLSTYYVDIKYYGRLIFSWDQKKDETIKIVISSNTPTLSITKVDNNYAISSDILKDGMGSGIVSEISYFFSNEPVTITNESDFKNASSASGTGTKATFTPSSKVSLVVESGETNYKYIHVMTKSLNKYYCIRSLNIETEADSPTNPIEGTDAPGTGVVDGFGDLEFGEIILLVLVVVLIVSCALIITQKIVDYKKRLY